MSNSYDFYANQQCSETRYCVSQTAVQCVKVLPGLSLAPNGLTSALPGLLPAIPVLFAGTPRVIPGCPRVVAGTPRVFGSTPRVIAKRSQYCCLLSQTVCSYTPACWQCSQARCWCFQAYWGYSLACCQSSKAIHRLSISTLRFVVCVTNYALGCHWTVVVLVARLSELRGVPVGYCIGAINDGI